MSRGLNVLVSQQRKDPIFASAVTFSDHVVPKANIPALYLIRYEFEAPGYLPSMIEKLSTDLCETYFSKSVFNPLCPVSCFLLSF